MFHRHIVALSLCLVPLISFSSTSVLAASAIVVKTAKANIQPVAPAIWFPGNVLSRSDAQLASEVSGRIISMREVGDQVKQGDLIAKLDDQMLRFNLEENRSTVNRLKAQVAHLKRQVARTQKLAKQRNSSQLDLDALVLERDMREQELLSANVTLKRTQHQINQSSLRAPFDGVVVSREKQPGEYISAGQSLVRLVNTNDLEISVRAPLHLNGSLAEGAVVALKQRSANKRLPSLQKARFFQTESLISEPTTPINSTFLGHIRRIVPVANASSRMLEIRIKPNHAQWMVGQAIEVELSDGTPQSKLTVPRDALVLRQDNVYVYTVSKEGIAQRVPVIIGEGIGSDIVVKGAISAGDSVIIRGAERLKPGQAVKVAEV